MSGLAYYLEDEGIATTLVALVRLHAERMRPPRALWVPFELGRPLGPPGDAAFQHRVLAAALGLLERDAGPVVLEDFAEEDPSATANPAWDFPGRIDAADAQQELAQVRPFYARALAARGRTTVGVSEVDLEVGLDWLLRLDDVAPPPPPRRNIAPVHLLRCIADDLKACYGEAATHGSALPAGGQLKTWLWTGTRLGETLRALRQRSLASGAAPRQQTANLLVPIEYRDA